MGELQNESRRFYGSRIVRIDALNDNVFHFTFEYTKTWVPAKAIGQLKYVDETETLVIGNIQQRIHFGIIYYFLTTTILTSVLSKGIGLFGFIIGAAVFCVLIVYTVGQFQVSTPRLLNELKQILDSNRNSQSRKNTEN
jgi:hypothetical protein